MRVWRMRIACSITKAINAHSGYEKRTACPLQRWLHVRASMLRYTQLLYQPLHIYKIYKIYTLKH